MENHIYNNLPPQFSREINFVTVAGCWVRACGVDGVGGAGEGEGLLGRNFEEGCGIGGGGGGGGSGGAGGF